MDPFRVHFLLEFVILSLLTLRTYSDIISFAVDIFGPLAQLVRATGS